MIQESYNLKNHTTFKIGGNAEFFSTIHNKQELTEAIEFAKDKNLKITIIGFGSNIIISDEGIKGLVLKLENKNIEIIEDNEDFSKIKSDAGIIWDDFVEFCVTQNLYGVENLSHVPGTVGACPIQNIGAYGQQASDTIDSVEAFDLDKNEFVTISKDECEFDYRKSIFNSSNKGKFIIYSVTFKLNKQGSFNLGYKDLAYFREDNDLNLQKIRNEIIKIRTNKIPSYEDMPNAGSFFKNIEINKEEFNNVLTRIKEIDNSGYEKFNSFYNEQKETIKIPTALLIDICGLKGFKWENIGVSENHALILVNHSKQGTSKELIDFSDFIINTIKEKLNLTIEREPTFIE